MKIAVVSKSGSNGGAAIASRRLTEALREQGAKATLVTAGQYPLRKNIPFIAGRLRLGGRLRNWRIDTGSFGLPIWNNPAVRDADAVILNWINQGMLSLDGIRKLGAKKLIWTMHDMWPMTGICHHAMDCRHFQAECGRCPLLGSTDSADLSHRIWIKKDRLYAGRRIAFVAVSSWLAEQARASGLLREQRVETIPNPFRPADITRDKERSTGRILFAAATLDNWIKGMDTLRRAAEILAGREIPGGKPEIWLMGALKDPAGAQGWALPTRHLGRVEGEDAVARVYARCDVTVNCSSFENLPGTLIEGQAYGAVPVAFDRGGQHDIIDHLSTGYIAGWSDDPAERAAAIADGMEWALKAAANEPEIRQRMHRSAAGKYSYGTIAAQYLQLIRDL